MNIGNDCVVVLHYTLRNSEGEVIESSFDAEPFAYLHGANNIVVGLERALDGKKIDDEFTADVSAADAYGEYDDSLIQQVEKNLFDGMDVTPGMQFHAETSRGMDVVTVREVSDDVVIIDANHPMAGMDLQFTVKVVSVREATDEEKDHGHVHAAGGCDH